MLVDLIATGVVRQEVDLSPMTTYKVGGPARWLFDAVGPDDLTALGPYGGPVLVIGRGSNLVVADGGFDGLVIRLGSGFGSIEIDGLSVRAGSSAPLPAVARAVAKAGISGLAWMVGVPGTVGGAVRMNAGCFGSDAATVLESALILNLRSGVTSERLAADLGFSYRTSNLTPHELVISGRFNGTPGDPHEIQERMREITRWRRDHQPGGTHNAGSVFKNPPGDAAGRIIDELGLKGLRVGKVSVSDKHANFFVAEPGASAQDIYDLVTEVKDIVRDKSGVVLVPEMVFVGFEG